MLSNLILVLLTQAIACTPGETSLVCNCKQDMVSACVTLVGEDARKAVQHHIISRPIAKRLASHLTLKGLYKPRDPRFVARARDEQSHCGYQEWHRDVDKEVINWLKDHPKARPQEFMDKLREIYGRPEMKARFPHGF